MRFAVILAVLSLVPARVRATEIPSFEAALGALRTQVLAVRAEQVEARDAALAADIRRLSRDLRRRDWDLRRLKDRLADLRRRAGRLERDRGGKRGDAFFENDLRRLVWDLRGMESDYRNFTRESSRLYRFAQKDPDSVQPAQELERIARRAENEAGWLQSEARWARMDLQRAGYNFEAYDIERYCDSVDRLARDLVRDARLLLGKVR